MFLFFCTIWYNISYLIIIQIFLFDACIIYLFTTLTPQIRGIFQGTDILRYITLPWLPVGDENYALIISYIDSICGKPIFHFWAIYLDYTFVFLQFHKCIYNVTNIVHL